RSAGGLVPGEALHFLLAADPDPLVAAAPPLRPAHGPRLEASSAALARERRGDRGPGALARRADDPVILFWILAIVTIPAALTVVLHRNPVYSALALVFTLLQVAIMFVALDAHLIAFLQVIIYAGAIVVLILFAIMLLSLEPEEPGDGRRWG